MNDSQRVQAASAWQAYNAMETTKRRHMNFLEVLEAKKRNFNIDPTTIDKERLALLLRDHDEQVNSFTHAARELKLSAPETHIALFTYIGQLNETPGNQSEDAVSSQPVSH